MNTTSWTYDSGYPSIFQGEDLNRSSVCLKSDWQALIHFFKSTWKRNSLLPERYEVLGLTVTWTDVWQASACDWEMCQSPFFLIHFIILEHKSGVCEAVSDFSFCLPEWIQGTILGRRLGEHDPSLSPQRAVLFFGFFGDEGVRVPFLWIALRNSSSRFSLAFSLYPSLAYALALSLPQNKYIKEHPQEDRLGEPEDHQSLGLILILPNLWK